MKAIVVVISIILLIAFVFVMVMMNQTKEELEKKYTEKKLYAGPVQEGYDEQLFRETGVYKKLE